MVEEPKPVRADNALLVFANFEKSDESHPTDVTEKAIAEIAAIAKRLKVKAVVLNPFAHLFAEASSPQVTVDMLNQLCAGLVKVTSMSKGLRSECSTNSK